MNQSWAVAPSVRYIELLLKQGRQLGVSAKLASKLNYLWRCCTGELTEQNALFWLAEPESGASLPFS
ncbi:hypothetical protein K6R70_004677 [Salmonella enterica]|nr:hypothetical protein [Salmonella enterica]EHZ8363786.1 hypothetical protein [Salmonella enterica]